MSYFENIVNKWSHKVKSGMPDINNFGHKLVLRQVLLEEGWDIRSANTLIDSLVEADKDDYVHLSRGIYVKSGDENKEDAQKYKKTDDGKFEPIEDEETPEEEPSQKLSGPEDFERPDTEEKPSDEDGKDNPQSKREETINKVLDLFVPPAEEQQGGAGRFAMTQEDIDDYKDWLKLTPEEREAKQRELVEKQIEKIGEVTEGDIDQFLVDLKEKLGKKDFDSLMTSIKKKGDPPGEYNTGKYPDDHPTYPGQYKATVRARNVIRHYLETGGVNPMNGKVVPFSESQLDHIVSLDNGGEDGPENWMWMEARINQFKGSLTDTEVEAKLIERDLKTAKELDKETSEAELKNWQTEVEIAYWETRFENNDIANLSVESIESMNADELTNLVKAWNRYVGEGDPRYIGRYGSSKVEISGKKHTISRDGVVKPDKNDPKTWGVTKQPDGSLKQTKMTYKQAQAAYNKARKSGGRGAGGDVLREGILNALTGVQSPFKDDEGKLITIPTKSEEDAVNAEFEAIQGEKAERKQYIKDLQKDIRANPQSADNLKKQLERDPEYKKYKEDIKKAAGKGKAKNPDNPEEYARLKKEYDEWRLNKWKEWQSLIGSKN